MVGTTLVRAVISAPRASPKRKATDSIETKKSFLDNSTLWLMLRASSTVRGVQTREAHRRGELAGQANSPHIKNFGSQLAAAIVSDNCITSCLCAGGIDTDNCLFTWQYSLPSTC